MSRSLAFYLAVLGIVAATAGPAVYLGHMEGVQAKMLEKASERLSLVPTSFGPWVLRDETSLSESVLQILGCSSHISRTYTNRDNGEVVALAILVGPAGPLAVHTPEICMTNREYENIKPAERIEIATDGRQQAVFETAFRARTLEGQVLNVYYAWSRDGEQWEAPESPRLALGPLPMLYKVQVACSEPAVPSEGPTAALSFLADLLPHFTNQANRIVAKH